MQLTKRLLTPLRLSAMAGLLLWGGLDNAALSQTYDPTDWYGDEDGYFDDYDDVTDYFYDESIYDPFDYDDDYFDYELDLDYDSRYFPGEYSRFPNYAAFGPYYGPNFYGRHRYFGPHLRYDRGYTLYEYPLGYNNYYFDGNLGRGYYTEDWYDDNSAFDEWY